MGKGGLKLRAFVDKINSKYQMPGHDQFMRIRGMGKLHHCKKGGQHSKNDNYKRRGQSRFEVCFEVYTKVHEEAIPGIVEEFMQAYLNEMVLFYKWQIYRDSLSCIQAEHIPCERRRDLSVENIFAQER